MKQNKPRMWQTRYDATLAALPLIFGLVKIDCCVASCDFNSSKFLFLIHFGQENLWCIYCSSANLYTCIKSLAIDCQAFKDRPLDRDRLVGHLCSSQSKLDHNRLILASLSPGAQQTTSFNCILKEPYLGTPGTDSCQQIWRVQLAD